MRESSERSLTVNDRDGDAFIVLACVMVFGMASGKTFALWRLCIAAISECRCCLIGIFLYSSLFISLDLYFFVHEKYK